MKVLRYPVLAALFCILCAFSLQFGEGASKRVLLIVTPSPTLRHSDVTFQTVSTFYGVRCDRLSITGTASTAERITDSSGGAYPLAVISDYRLEALSPSWVQVLKNYVTGGGSLLVNDVLDDPLEDSHANLRALTDGRIAGAAQHGELDRQLRFAADDPALTGVFTAQNLVYAIPNGPPFNQSLDLKADSSVHQVISSVDLLEQPFCYFARCALGSGTIYVSSAAQNSVITKLGSFYNTEHGAEVIPSMLVVSSVYGAGAWHGSESFANFTIDDQPLADIPGKLDYAALLGEMQTHKFHTTIAYIPNKYTLGENTPMIEQVFVNNPEYYSTMQHGDFHLSYEFFVYTSAESAEVANSPLHYAGFSPVPLERQEELIVDGLSKLNLMQRNLGLPRSRVMVFPYGISPGPTLSLLEKYNYSAELFSQEVPLLSSPDSAADAGMLPANPDFGDIALLERVHPYSVSDVTHTGSLLSWGVLNLFIGKPALYYSHIGEAIPPASGFSSIADSLNSLTIAPQWKSLDYIAEHLYVSKTNDDGSDSVQVFGNTVVLQNASAQQKIVHIRKKESAYPLLSEVRIDGAMQTFVRLGGYAWIDIVMSANSSSTVQCFHETGSVDFSVSPADIRFPAAGMDVIIHNTGDSAGYTSVILTDTSAGGVIELTPAVKVNAHDTSLVHFQHVPSTFATKQVIVNPFAIGPEKNTANNVARLFSLPRRDKLTIDNFQYTDSPLNHGWSMVQPAASGSFYTSYDRIEGSFIAVLGTTSGTRFGAILQGGPWWRDGISMKIKAHGDFVIYVQCKDSASNQLYIKYTPDNGPTTKIEGYIICHIGTGFANGLWDTLTRNLSQDAAAAGWPASITQIIGVELCGPMEAAGIVAGESFQSPQPTYAIETPKKNPKRSPFSLSENYPNPFNPATQIRYHVNEAGFVRLSVYNILGQEVAALVNGEQAEGDQSAEFDGSNLPSGLYFYRITIGAYTDVKKMILIK